MRSLILQTATRFLMTLILIFSVFLLLRGHDEPGGGFIGGLVAGGTFALYTIAFDVESAKRALRFDPRHMLAVGLLLAAASTMAGVLAGRDFFTHLWFDLVLPGLGTVHLGTTLLFDIGVYLVVTGVTMTIIFALAEE